MRKGPPGSTDATRRRDVVAYAMHALAANGFGDAAGGGFDEPLKPPSVAPRLGPRTLHYLRFDRSEPSVAAQTGGDADRARAHAAPRQRRSFR